jgi:hypothetical protein
MVKISKLHAGTSNGIKNGGHKCKMQLIMQGIKEKNPLELQYEPELTVVIAPEDTTKQKA